MQWEEKGAGGEAPAHEGFAGLPAGKGMVALMSEKEDSNSQQHQERIAEATVKTGRQVIPEGQQR